MFGGVLAAAGYGLPHNFKLPEFTPTYKDIVLDLHQLTVRCAPGQILEPAAIVKGLAIDAAARHLSPVSAWMINAGGDILTHGDFPEQGDWNIGIQDPLDRAALLTTIPLRNAAVATSGTYQTQWLQNGRKWNHQINLQRNTSAVDVVSLTVLADTAQQADTLASLGLLLGVSAGCQFLQKAGVAFLMVDAMGEFYSSGFPF